MSDEATSRNPESDVTSVSIHPSPFPCPSPSRSDGGDSIDLEDAMVDEFIWDPMEDRIEAQIVDQLFRGADPEVRRQVAAQQEALRARKEELRRELARRLREYTDLLQADVSGYSDAQRAEYERELDRRSKQLFGGDA